MTFHFFLPMQDFPDGKGADSKEGRAPIYYSGRSRIFLGAPTPKVGVLTYFLQIFCRKLHENEIIWIRQCIIWPSFPQKVTKIHKGLYFNLIWREFAFIPPDGSIGLG